MTWLRLGMAPFGLSLLIAVAAMAQGLPQTQTAGQTAGQTAHREIAAAETNLFAQAGGFHSQYQENIQPGDGEHGFTPGFTIGGGVLMPSALPNLDLYGAFSYEYTAGNLTYNGHYQPSGTPLTATDGAAFNRVEGRVGLGLPVAGGVAEAIPFLAGGYQSWNRNVTVTGGQGADEVYSSGMAGGGVKLDIPITATIVASGTAELLGLVGTHIEVSDYGIGSGMGDSAQERVSLGLDDALHGPLHVQASADWEHFNYAGSQPFDGIYEPSSTTTQFGVNLGLAYSF